MDKNEPILELNEFEEEQVAILDLAKREASKIIQEAKNRADEIIRGEKEAFSVREKEYLEKTEEEINIEKNKLILESKGLKKSIETIPEERIRQAVHFVLQRILPQEA